jgi:hypothetical protein
MNSLMPKKTALIANRFMVYFQPSFELQLITMCDNLIPGMDAACRKGVESGRLMYASMFGHITTFVYMSYRPNESFVPKQQKKQCMSVFYCCWRSEWQQSGAADIHRGLCCYWNVSPLNIGLWRIIDEEIECLYLKWILPLGFSYEFEISLNSFRLRKAILCKSKIWNKGLFKLEVKFLRLQNICNDI